MRVVQTRGARGDGYRMVKHQGMAYQERLSRAVINSMSPGLVGLYLHGSLALDDFVAGKSDVDLCAVVSELRDGQRRSLVNAISLRTIPLEAGGFDLHVVTLDTALTAGWAPVREMWVAAHPGWEFHVEGRAADHDRGRWPGVGNGM